MKKVIALLLAALMLCSMLCACGGSEEPAVQDQATEAASPVQSDKNLPAAAEAFAGGSGTEADPYQIADAAQLALLAEKMGDSTYSSACYVLTGDITLNDVSGFENWNASAPEYVWEPLGRTTNIFSGVFDGNGHTVSGMYISDAAQNSEPQDRYYGLFARVSGTVKNLNMEQCFIAVTGSNVSAGSVVGQIMGDGVVENCDITNVDVYVTESSNAGGIAGQDGVIRSCTFSGVVSQKDDSYCHLGGIVGYGGNVSDCTFVGVVHGSGYSGGIAGWGKVVENCLNNGSVHGDTAGGIAGNLYQTGMGIEPDVAEIALRSCMNKGAITAVSAAGGIVGKVGNDEVDVNMVIADCENYGSVTCDEVASGIVAILSSERASQMKVENCTNHANLTGVGKIGGIIGELKGAVLHQQGEVTVSGCTNSGSLTSEGMYCGGIVSYFMLMGAETDLKLNIEKCDNSGNITSLKYAGGILCFSTSAVAANVQVSANSNVCVAECSNSGSIVSKSTNSFAGGIIGNYGIEQIPTVIENCVNTGAVRIEAELTEEEIKQTLESGADMTISQIAGGIVGRIGEGLLLTTDNDGDNASGVNAANARIQIRGCKNSGQLYAPDFSEHKTEEGKQIWVNYIGGIVGNYCGEAAYGFAVEDCTFTGAERGLGNSELPDIA